MHEDVAPSLWSAMDERYVRRDSHEYQTLLSEMSTATKTTERIERYLVGGIDENGRYKMGMSAWVKVLAIAGSIIAAVGIAVVSAFITHALRI